MATQTKTRSSASAKGRGRKTTKAQATQTRRGPKKLTGNHKAALAEGRRQGHAVRRYLDALDSNKPKRGRPMNVERIKTRLAQISDKIDTASPSVRVQLTQERINLLEKLSSAQGKNDMSTYEKDFVKFAKGYSERKGISFTAWKQMGVPADVLKRAGLAPRTRGKSRTK
jgi:hypothetical protein